MVAAKKDIDMLNGPLTKNIIAFTVPIILTGILQLLFNAADLVIVGRFCGSNSVAAVGATNSLINLIVNFFMGLSIGAGVTIAHALGAHHERDVSDAVHTSIPTAAICGVIIMIIGVFGSEPLLRLMGNPDDVIAKSTIYMQIYFCGSIGSLLYNFGAAILRAVGDTKSPLIFLTFAGVINVLFNVMFVVFFDMDVAGVALATAISQTISAVLVLIKLMRRDDCCKLQFKKLKISMRPLSKILRIGVPSGIQSSLFSISNVIIQSSINSFGSVVMSGSAAASSIEGFVYTAQNSFSQTAVNFVGQNVGARKYDRVMKIFWRCMLLCTVLSLTLGGLSFVFSKELLSIYINDSAEAIGYGVIRMSIFGFTYFLAGLMDITTGTLRGMGKSVLPMIVSILGVCAFRVVWIYTLFEIPQFHTLEWLFISYPISWTIVLVTQGILTGTQYIKLKKGSSNLNRPNLCGQHKKGIYGSKY